VEQFQTLVYICSGKLCYQFVEVAVHYIKKSVAGEVNPVVSDPVLREVVCSYLLTSLSSSYLRSSGLDNFIFRLRAIHLVEFSTKYLEGPGLVLVLRSLLLYRNNDSRWFMNYPDR